MYHITTNLQKYKINIDQEILVKERQVKIMSITN